MDKQWQFEVMAMLRSYAAKIAHAPAHDLRPSTAKSEYADPIKRMVELVKTLDTAA